MENLLQRSLEKVLGQLEKGQYTSMESYTFLGDLVVNYAYEYALVHLDDRPGVVFRVTHQDDKWYYLRHSVSHAAKLTRTDPPQLHVELTQGKYYAGNNAGEEPAQLDGILSNKAQAPQTAQYVELQGELERYESIVSILKKHSPEVASQIEMVRVYPLQSTLHALSTGG